MSSRWRERRPPEEAWKPRKGASKSEGQREQDAAAGGRSVRAKTTVDGRVVTASISLRVQPAGRRIYAYLRWFEEGSTRERYVGEVAARTRAENLAIAWRIVEEKRFLDPASDPRPLALPNPDPVSENSRAVMRANKSKDTKPERLLRSAVFARGLRYRVHRRPVRELNRTADLVFVGVKVAVFVDGCFWHGCPEHHRSAKRNSEFWDAKIQANRERDRDTGLKLEEAGWRVIRIWEHEAVADAADRIVVEVSARRSALERRHADEGL